MLRSELRLTTGLFVAQAAVSNHTGLIARSGLAMPAAPFGSAAWQLPALVAYLHRLHQDEEDPSPELWRTHTERQTGPVPRPQRRYQGNGLHDPDAVCVLDIQLGPREEGTGWPAADLAVIEQEEGACPFGRVTRRHGTEAIAAHTAQELSAEHDRLMDRARQHQDTYLVRLADLTQRAAEWADKVRAAAHADTVHAQADRARARITR
ncbi:hypothetical protein [Streptomyces pseudovenezuelae]|uniref:Transcriptional regulator n=1 Tax=Streptomyces pseudovenezuelae TaxID=67350 RepID=A0ABT6M4C3_9ACTN|nr:hypothetical protein [Streptomyces pseudovenezuelae]MDH6222836.1 hypothetical protein [Streptomyces pseudovenezuelae]